MKSAFLAIGCALIMLACYKGDAQAVARQLDGDFRATVPPSAPKEMVLTFLRARGIRPYEDVSTRILKASIPREKRHDIFAIRDQLMTNLRFSSGHRWMLCLVLAFLYDKVVTGAQPERQLATFANAYRAAGSESERRAVCLHAIDAGVIARDRSVAAVDAVFGTTYSAKLPKGPGVARGVVHFHPPLPSGSDAVASAYIGWYLAFEFDSAGRLQNYYLSNVQK